MRTLKLKDDIWLHLVFLSTASCLVKTRGSHVLLHVCALSFLPLHLSLIFFTCQMIDCPLNTRLTVIDSSQIIHGNVSLYSHAELPESKPPRISGRLTHLWKNAHLWVQKSIDYLGWTWIKFLFLPFPAVCPWLVPLICGLWMTAFTVKCCWDDCPSPWFSLDCWATSGASFFSFFQFILWKDSWFTVLC